MNGTGNQEVISAETVPEWTYFIQQASGEIKIGRSIQPRARMGTLQSANGSKLAFLMAVPSSRITESAAHQKFWHLRVHGEWFRPKQELLDFIDLLKTEAKKPIRRARPVPPKKMIPVVGKLYALRQAHGGHTPIGHCCTNLAEQIKNMDGYEAPSWATHEMQTLPGLMKIQMRRLEQLRAALQ